MINVPKLQLRSWRDPTPTRVQDRLITFLWITEEDPEMARVDPANSRSQLPFITTTESVNDLYDTKLHTLQALIATGELSVNSEPSCFVRFASSVESRSTAQVQRESSSRPH